MDDFNNIRRELTRATNENSKTEVCHALSGKDESQPLAPRYTDILHDNLQPVRSAADMFPKPDMYDGAELGSVEMAVREGLSGVVLPLTLQSMAPLAPNFYSGS
jgi:hypothetical protein